MPTNAFPQRPHAQSSYVDVIVLNAVIKYPYHCVSAKVQLFVVSRFLQHLFTKYECYSFPTKCPKKGTKSLI